MMLSKHQQQKTLQTQAPIGASTKHRVILQHGATTIEYTVDSKSW